MTILDYITIFIFTVGILTAGMSFSKTGSSMKSFFAAGGDVPWWISGLSLFMGFFSAGTFVVWGSIAYSYGWVAITIQLTMCVAGFVVGIFLAPRWKNTNVLTAAEYITNRLGLKVQKVYTFIFLFISLFTTGAFLYPVAKIVEVTTGFPLQSSILLLGCICILYVTVGGLRAVVVTDVLQFVILTAAVLIVVPLSFEKTGGVHAFLDKTPTGFFDIFNGEFTPLFIVAFVIYNIFFLGGNWSYIQRYTSVRSKKDARKVGLLFGSLYLIAPILWMLPPMIYRTINPELSGLANEGAYLMMCKMALPQGLLGLMLGGMVFATASSLNGSLNIAAGVFTNDIFKLMRPNSSNTLLMRVARYSTIGFGLIAIVVALLIPLMGGIVNVVISLAALTGVPLYLPIIWTLFSKRQNARSVLSATLISLAINAIFKFITPLLFDFSLDRAEEMLLGGLVPLVIMTIFEIYYILKNKRDTKYAEYVIWRQNRENEVDIELADSMQSANSNSDNKQSYKVIGIGISLTGIAIFLLGLLASGFQQEVVLTLASLLIALGGWIFIKTRR
ncbi:MAG: Na+:solute symporter [Paludibacter sp.]|nr:Na+:solute symporter [Paludibacter sp.]